MRAHTQETQSAQPPASKLIGIHRPRAYRAAKAVAEIVRVIEQGGWHRGYPTG